MSNEYAIYPLRSADLEKQTVHMFDVEFGSIPHTVDIVRALHQILEDGGQLKQIEKIAFRGKTNENSTYWLSQKPLPKHPKISFGASVIAGNGTRYFCSGVNTFPSKTHKLRPRQSHDIVVDTNRTTGLVGKQFVAISESTNERIGNLIESIVELESEFPRAEVPNILETELVVDAITRMTNLPIERMESQQEYCLFMHRIRSWERDRRVFNNYCVTMADDNDKPITQLEINFVRMPLIDWHRNNELKNIAELAESD